MSEERTVEGRRSLDRSFLKGLAWTAGVKWLGQILSWASTIVVARLLSPADYGIVAMATVFLGLVGLINEFGLGLAVVKHRDLTQKQLTQIHTLSVLVGVGAVIVSLVAAYPIAWLYRSRDVMWVVVVFSVNFLLSAFRTVPMALLERDLDFRTVATNEGIQVAILSVLSVVLAALGLRYWTLVAASIVSSGLSAALMFAKRPQTLAWPRYKDIGEALTFGGHITATRAIWHLYSNADIFIAGRVLGQALAGVYSFGLTLANIPIDRISGVVGRVIPSVISAVQNDKAEMRRYLLNMTEALSVVTVPAALGVSLVAPAFVDLFLGPKWQGLIVVLQIISLNAAYRSVTTIIAMFAPIIGLARFSMWQSFVSGILMTVGFVVGSRWGIFGMALVWITVNPVLVTIYAAVVFYVLELKVSSYFRALFPSLSSAAVMVPCVYFAQQLIRGTPTIVQFAFPTAVGAAGYIAALLLLHRSRARAMVAMLRRFRKAQD